MVEHWAISTGGWQIVDGNRSFSCGCKFLMAIASLLAVSHSDYAPVKASIPNDGAFYL